MELMISCYHVDHFIGVIRRGSCHREGVLGGEVLGKGYNSATGSIDTVSDIWQLTKVNMAYAETS